MHEILIRSLTDISNVCHVAGQLQLLMDKTGQNISSDWDFRQHKQITERQL